jgi:nucleoside-diphosphate-sugar epimerase
LTCYTLESAREMVGALRGRVAHFLHCGTIWVHGRSIEVPVTEDCVRKPSSDYGVRKAAIEEYLLTEARVRGFPATILHPGHLVGRGWVPLNPAANFNPRVFTALMREEEVPLPNIGMETVHHVHAADVAQAFINSLAHRSVSIGESFHVTSPAALTLAGYAEIVASWFAKKANLKFLPWEDWRAQATERDAQITWDHISRSPNCSIRKAEELIGYRPRFRSAQAVRESVEWLAQAGKLEV